MACELVTKTQIVDFDVKFHIWRQRSRFQLLPSELCRGSSDFECVSIETCFKQIFQSHVALQASDFLCLAGTEHFFLCG